MHCAALMPKGSWQCMQHPVQPVGWQSPTFILGCCFFSIAGSSMRVVGPCAPHHVALPVDVETPPLQTSCGGHRGDNDVRHPATSCVMHMLLQRPKERLHSCAKRTVRARWSVCSSYSKLRSGFP